MKEKKLKITHFTDPKCFWCYAMEPEMRKIRVLAGDQLEYSIIMGVLVSDVREVIGYDALAMARFEQMRTHLASIQTAVDGIRTINYRQYEDSRLTELTDRIEQETAILME